MSYVSEPLTSNQPTVAGNCIQANRKKKKKKESLIVLSVYRQQYTCYVFALLQRDSARNSTNAFPFNVVSGLGILINFS